MKLLSKYITFVFKLIFNQASSHNKQCSYFSEVDYFCTTLNNQRVIFPLNKFNGRGKTNSISSFVFCTLYTKITHDILLKAFNELVDFCLNPFLPNVPYWSPWKYQKSKDFLMLSGGSKKKIGRKGLRKGNKEFVSVDGHGGTWAKKRRSGVEVFMKSILKKAVKYLLENCYFKLRNRTFREIVGILMGSNPALFLY